MNNSNHFSRGQKSHERFHPYQRGGENKRWRGGGRWNSSRRGHGIGQNPPQPGNGLQQALDERNQMLHSESRQSQGSSHRETYKYGSSGDGRNNQKGGIHACDACDRSFPTEQAQQQHFAEHVTCNLDGCTFTSHPKILLKHIEMQHSNNLFSRLKKLKDPEDLSKWKEERKKNYPTSVTIERKVKEKEERIARGERYTGSDRRGRGGRGRPGGRHGSNQQQQRTYPEAKVHSSKDASNSLSAERASTSTPPTDIPVQKEQPVKKERKVFTYGEEKHANFSKHETLETIVLDNFYSKVKVKGEKKLVGTGLMNWNSSTLNMVNKIAGTGLSMRYLMSDDAPMSDSEEELNIAQDDVNITDDEDWQASDTEGTSHQEEEKPRAPGADVGTVKVVGPALGLVAYSDDSDSDGEAPLEVAIVKPSDTDSSQIVEEPQNELKSPEQAVEKDQIHELASEVDNSNAVPNEPESRSSRKAKSTTTTTSKFPKSKRRQRMPQLLQKLLANDIRKERNQILQVCRFICENNFFDASASRNTIESRSSAAVPEVEAIVPEVAVNSVPLDPAAGVPASPNTRGDM